MSTVSEQDGRSGIASELVSYLGKNKRWWLLPICVMCAFMAVLIILGQSSAIAPFIYTLF